VVLNGEPDLDAIRVKILTSSIDWKAEGEVVAAIERCAAVRVNGKPKGDQRLTTVNFSTHPAYQHDTKPELTAAELPEEE